MILLQGKLGKYNSIVDFILKERGEKAFVIFYLEDIEEKITVKDGKVLSEAELNTLLPWEKDGQHLDKKINEIESGLFTHRYGIGRSDEQPKNTDEVSWDVWEGMTAGGGNIYLYTQNTAAEIIGKRVKGSYIQ